MPRLPSLEFELVTFTPEAALELLDKYANKHNRTLRQRRVNDFAEDMRNGKWEVNGEAIVFAKDGTLLNGHHRLWACTEAKVPFTSAVVRGVNPDVFASFDQHTQRTATDAIYINGSHKYQRQIATACSLLIRYNDSKVMHNEKVAPRDVVKFFDEHPDIETWVEAACGGDMRPYAAPIAAVMYSAAPKYRSRCVEFVRGLVDGADLVKGSPILALRNRLMTSGDRKLTGNERFALIIQGWNAFIEGRTLQRMQLFTGDQFPKIRGATY